MNHYSPTQLIFKFSMSSNAIKVSFVRFSSTVTISVDISLAYIVQAVIQILQVYFIHIGAKRIKDGQFFLSGYSGI